MEAAIDSSAEVRQGQLEVRMSKLHLSDYLLWNI